MNGRKRREGVRLVLCVGSCVDLPASPCAKSPMSSAQQRPACHYQDHMMEVAMHLAVRSAAA